MNKKARTAPSLTVRAMSLSHSVDFFERQFQRQLREQEHTLNPFEQAALPWLRGRVLDYAAAWAS